MGDKPKIITPLMNDVIIKKHISDAEIVTLGWGESYKKQEIQLNSKSFREDEFKGDVEFYLEPAQHWSARGIFDKNKAL